MGENWSLSQEEDLHRQNLFRKARKGDEKTALELQEVYGAPLVRKKRAMLVYDTPKRGKRKA